MKNTCKRCGKEKEGATYRIYYGKVLQAGQARTLSDGHGESLFLCNSCARSRMRTPMLLLTIFLLLFGLGMGYVFVMTLIDPPQDAPFLFPCLGGMVLALLVPIYWTMKSVLKRVPSQLDGEQVALNMRAWELQPLGYKLFTSTDFKKYYFKELIYMPLDPDIPDAEAVVQMVQIYREYRTEVNIGGSQLFWQSSEANRIREIGELLNKRGGMESMLAAHESVSRTSGVESAAENLKQIWDGIGDWKA